MRVVVLDAMGVLYRCADDLVDLLIPFARANGCRLSDDGIGALYRAASRGEFTSTELWRRLGIDGDPATADEAYLQSYEVTPGIPELLDDLGARGVWLGCISNDLAEWSRILRKRHDLGRRIGHWTVSADVGARKPDERIYRAFLASTGLAPGEILFADDRVKNVDAAAALGFQTVLVDLAAIGHGRPVARTIGELRTAVMEWISG